MVGSKLLNYTFHPYLGRSLSLRWLPVSETLASQWERSRTPLWITGRGSWLNCGGEKKDASRSYILGSVKGRPKKLSKTPVTQVIDCSLCYRKISGTGAPGLGPLCPYLHVQINSTKLYPRTLIRYQLYIASVLLFFVLLFISFFTLFYLVNIFLTLFLELHSG